MGNENFIIIQGWMVNELKLKGNDLIVFAIIYGFSQDKGNKCTVSLKYFQNSLNVSKNTVLKSISFLTEKEFITKEQSVFNNVTFNAYFFNKDMVQKMNNGLKKDVSVCSENELGAVHKLTKGGSVSEHNNAINNITKNIEDNKTLFPEGEIDFPIQILNYLNEKKPSKIPFKPTPQNLTEIKTRIKEKYSFEDFKRVIDFKISEWANDKKMKQYIRPETLFGGKFDGYLIRAMEGNYSNDGSQNFELNQTEKADLI